MTPSVGLIRTAREVLTIPLYPIVRPREGDFLYSEEEFQVMLRDVQVCKEIGCDGVVIGMLLPDGGVDKERCARLVEKAYPLGVTFHRAFDRAANPFEALEAIVGLGCERILTSGQRPVAMEGSELISELVRQADDRIVIMPGSGVRASNVSELMLKTKTTEVHTTARTNAASRMGYVNPAMQEDLSMVMPDEEEVRKIKEIISAL